MTLAKVKKQDGMTLAKVKEQDGMTLAKVRHAQVIHANPTLASFPGPTLSLICNYRGEGLVTLATKTVASTSQNREVASIGYSARIHRATIA